MNNFTVYIITDNNRNFLEVKMNNNMHAVVQEIALSAHQSFCSVHKLTRIIYAETYSTESQAEKRRKELSQYTRMQKERIIRRTNTNWKCLNTHYFLAQKNVVITAIA